MWLFIELMSIPAFIIYLMFAVHYYNENKKTQRRLYEIEKFKKAKYNMVNINLQKKAEAPKRRVSFIVPDFKALGALSMQKAKSK